MPNEGPGAAVFRAIADFAAVRREARRTADELRRLKAEGGKTSDSFERTEKSSDRASRSFARFAASVKNTATALNDSGKRLQKLQQDATRASDALEQARRREADAAGKVRVAEAQLNQVRESGGQNTARLVEAEERLAAAGRRLEASEANTARRAEESAGAHRNLARALGDVDQQSNRSSGVLGRLATVLGNVHQRLSNVERSRAGGIFRDLASAGERLGGTLAGLRNKTVVFSLLAAGAVAAIGPIFGLIGAVVALSGALGVVPALAGAGGAAIGTIAIGLIGLKDAFKSAGASAGSFAGAQKAMDRAAITGAEQVQAARQRVADVIEQGARRVQSAERALTAAQKDAKRAQDDLNRAREEAIKDLRDLHLSLKGAELDERGATLALARARERLAEVQASGAGGLDLQEAQLGVDEAVQALEEAKVRYSDLKEEAAKADAAGVDGAEKVAAARERVADADQAERDAAAELAQTRKDAARDVADAERELAKAVRDAGWAQQDAAAQLASAAGKAGPVISGAARDFVNAVKGLGPAFNAARLDIQEKLFAGLGDKVRTLGGIYIPLLRTQLGGMATTFNGMAKDFADWLAQKSTVDDMGASLKNINGFWSELRAAVKPVAQAFLDIFKTGTEFLPELGKSLADAAKRFADFIHQARESGKLKEWIGAGIQALKDLLAILGNLAGVFFAVFRGGQSEGNGLLQMLRDLTKSTKDYLNSAEGQAKIADLFRAVREAGHALQPVIKALFEGLVKVFPVAVKIAEALGPGLADLINGIAKAIKSAEPQLVGLGHALGDLFSAIGNASPIIAIIIKALAFAAAPLGVLADLLRVITKLFELLPKPIQDGISTIGGLGLAILIAVPLLAKLLKIGGKITGVFKDASAALLGTGKAAKTAAADAAEASGADTVVAGGGSDDKKKKGKKGKTAAGGKGRFGLLGTLVGVAGISEAFDMGDDAVDAFGKGAEGKSEGVRKSIAAGLMGAGGIAAMFGPFGLIVGAALAAIALIIANWDKIGPILGKIWDGIKSLAVTVWTAIKDFFVYIWGVIWGAISTAAQAVWDFLTMIWNGIVTGVTTAWNAVGTAISTAWDWIKGTVSGAAQAVWDFLTGAWNGIVDGVRAAWRWAGEAISTAWDWIKGVVSGAVDAVTGFLGRIGDWISSTWQSIWDGAGRVVSGVIDGIKRVVGGIVDFIGDAVRKIGDFLGKIGGGVRDAAGWVGRNLNPLNWFSKGGLVPGSGDQDTVDSKLTPGEYVEPKKAVKRWLPLLRAINPYDQGGSPLDLQAMTAALVNNAAGGDGVAMRVATASRLESVGASLAGAATNNVSITNVIHNPVPERASTSIHREAQKLAIHGIVALADTTDRSRR